MTNEHTSQKEFIFLVALLTALVAMSIDTMLPAIGTMASEFGVSDPNKRQYIIGAFFAGMTIGTLLSGPISDSTGRKPAIFAGLLIYVAGSLLSLFSTSFEMLLAGRALQGVGASSPRIVSLAMVRDGQGGAAMARIMSFVMSVFMLVPILAPSIGQLVLFVASWRMIFVGFLAMALIAALLLQFRQEETLPKEKRVAFSAGTLFRSAIEFFRFPSAWGYTVSVGFVFASFICYLGTSQQIFAEQYAQGEWFAVWFGVFAIAIAFAMIFNGRMVMRPRHAYACQMGGARLHRVFRHLPCCSLELRRPSAALDPRSLHVRHLLLFRHPIRQLQRHGHGACGPHCRHGGGHFRHPLNPRGALHRHLVRPAV
nr:Major Facilitator Superfamily [uncultured bacterium]